MIRSNRTQPSSLPKSRRMYAARRGNLLVGCGVVILVLMLLVGIGTFYVFTNVRGWTASASKQAIDAVLTESNIDPAEHAEIMVHIDSLMTRFEEGEIEWAQLGEIVEKLVESPVIPAAMVMGIDSLYIAQSDLEDSEKAQARTDLARYTQGLCSKSIDESSIADVLGHVTTNSPDDNDIRLNLHVGPNGQSVTALKSADEVSVEELRELIATAKAKADEAEISQTPDPIDLSDEIAKAIGIALNEIPDDSENTQDATDTAEDAADAIDNTTPPTPDGP